MDFLLERFRTGADQAAFVHDDRRVTYGEVLDKVRDYKALVDRQLSAGDVVVVLGDYSPELFCFILAVKEKRCVLVPVTRESVVEIPVILELSGAQWVVDFPSDGSDPLIKPTGILPSAPLLVAFLKQGEPGLILFSSGSTGKPKAILHNLSQVTEKFRKPRKSVVAITFLMLDHFGGINTLLAITASLGTVITVKIRSVNAICETVQKHRVEVLPTTPSFLNLLVRSGAHEQFDLSSLKLITYGTEVMPEATLERLKKIFPQVKLQQTYGLSELGVLRSKSRDDGSLWVQIGGEGFKTKVIDDILWIKSDYAMVGYLNAPSPFDDEGWFNTEDRVEVDGDYFRILGRVTDLMNIGGQKVYPAEIEEVVLGLDNIEDVAVFAEKNALLGSIIVAQVVLREAESIASLKRRIRQACSDKLAAFKVPSKVVIAETSIYSARHKKIRRSKEI